MSIEKEFLAEECGVDLGEEQWKDENRNSASKIELTSPLLVELPRKTKADKKIYLNLNVYRNLHYIVNNQAKELYNEIMYSQLKGLKFNRPISVTYKLYKKSHRRLDRANVLSIVEKFFCDAMVAHGCIPDDNDDYISASHYVSGEVDSENPRVEITICEV